MSALAADAQLKVELAPAPFSEEVAVTAARTLTRVSETAASVVVISREDVAATAALTLDDALRQVPGFTLFRRSGSRTANPTSQGVSLRGVGASGASRAVVLADGIPINDPFGGWVYWGRVPREAVSASKCARRHVHLYEQTRGRRDESHHERRPKSVFPSKRLMEISRRRTLLYWRAVAAPGGRVYRRRSF